MDVLTIKEASLVRGIPVRIIAVLCNQGRISGARKIAGAWLLPPNAEKPSDARIKSGKYTGWRIKPNMSSEDFDKNLKNLKGTFPIENMTVSAEGIRNLKEIGIGEVSCITVIEDLTLKYRQRV